MGNNRAPLRKGEATTSFVVSKPSPNDLKSTSASSSSSSRLRLSKSGSKKVTLQTSTTVRYDESFMRYVNGFDSYFKASELRYQNSSKEEAKSTHELSRSRARYATEASSSVEATSSGSLSDTRSFSLDSPRSPTRKRNLPRVSLVYDTAPHIELLDSPKSFSETASSYYATPDQDRSFITTPSDNYSFFATASEQSSYLTAELDSLDESHTFVQDAKQCSSQETLYNENDEDIFVDDNEDEDDEDDEVEEDADEMRDFVAELAGPSSSSGSSSLTAAFSRLNLHQCDDEARQTTSNVLMSPECEKCSLEARRRRSNFVRSTCIDLEEEEEEEDGEKSDLHPLDSSSPAPDECGVGDVGRSSTDSPT